MVEISETSVRIRVEPDEGSPSHPCKSCRTIDKRMTPGIDDAWTRADGVVSLNLVLTYPPTYPDVAPEISFETIEDDDEEEATGELTEEETETVLGELNTIVSPGIRSEGQGKVHKRLD
jgi:hypothetical protein